MDGQDDIVDTRLKGSSHRFKLTLEIIQNNGAVICVVVCFYCLLATEESIPWKCVMEKLKSPI